MLLNFICNLVVSSWVDCSQSRVVLQWIHQLENTIHYFSSLPNLRPSSLCSMSDDVNQSAVPNSLTLIITTSPTPSAPSTALLSSVLQSFRSHCKPLLKCRVIVVFDTFERVTSASRLKKGCVTLDSIGDYDEYKENCKALFLKAYEQSTVNTKCAQSMGEAEFGSPNSTLPVSFTLTVTEDGRISFIEATDRRLGFGLAVRTALRMVRTPYVWVHQHDWSLIRDIPLLPLLCLMQDHDLDTEKPIKYVCLPSSRRMSYGTSDQVIPFPELRKLSLRLTYDFPSSHQPAVTLPLTPMFFWHDKPHIASTTHYLQRVFPSRFSISRGSFIEDTIGHVARNQMKDGQWEKWATWLYNPGGGKQPCLQHLHGRTWKAGGAHQIKHPV